MCTCLLRDCLPILCLNMLSTMLRQGYPSEFVQRPDASDASSCGEPPCVHHQHHAVLSPRYLWPQCCVALVRTKKRPPPNL